jgi:BirA family biotin operon repressor/biotin-[acetyl-CoA-carboxylase] ligase
MHPATLFDLSRAAALAIAQAIEAWSQGVVRPALKWPNDLWAEGRKLGGILIENRWAGAQPEWAVVGLGLNVRQTVFAPGVAATSLLLLTGHAYDVAEGAAYMHKHLATCLGSWADKQALRQAYDARLLGLGQAVQLAEPGQPSFVGTILGTTDAGLLRVSTAEGVKTYDLKEIKQPFATGA